MKTELFEEGVKKLLDLAKKRRVCIMCMEKNPKKLLSCLELCG